MKSKIIKALSFALATALIGLGPQASAKKAKKIYSKSKAAKTTKTSPSTKKKKVQQELLPVAPLTDAKKIKKSHAPFEAGECKLCHKSNNKKKPGALREEVNTICYQCHDVIKNKMGSMSSTHPAVEDSCTACHNPHNSTQLKLLRASPPRLCYECHDDIQDLAEKSKVHHDAVIQGKACLNCHDPHASNVEHLLLSAPFDLCISCHSNDKLVDEKGVKLSNFKKLLKKNKYIHAPVAAKDCSACHDPHGGAHTRLLKKAYPAKFYAPYDPKNYELCYQCHNNKIMANAKTTTLTGFRDGDRNLHYLHVNMKDRGRTCRACHEVHAAPHPHIIRKGVPYGSSGWMLPINFTQTPTGGSCAKTCHSTKTYKNRSKPRAHKEKKGKR